jgi:hypothetical protein
MDLDKTASNKRFVSSIPHGVLSQFLKEKGGVEGRDSALCVHHLEGGIGDAPPVYVQSYSTTNLSEFLRELEESGDVEALTSWSVERCGKIWFRYRCDGDGKEHFVRKPWLCRRRRWCPRCADAYVRLKVEHAIETFEMIEGWRDIELYLIHLEFTFPQEFWQGIVDDPDPAFECVYEALRYPNGLSGGIAALHLWHSRNPLDGWYPHIAVVVPNVVVVKNGGLKWFRRVRPWFNEKLLKERFAKAIEKRFGVKVEPNVYVSYVKFSDKARVKHLLRYTFRLPIHDLVPYLKGGLSDEVKKFVVELVNYPRKRIRWFGWLADGVKSRYMPFVKWSDWLKKKKEEWMFCPIHHKPLVYVGYDGLDPPI